MHFGSIVVDALTPFWWVLPALMVAGLFRLPRVKGMVGESVVKLGARISLPKHIYHPIHNVTLKTLDGTTQIDHIYVSRYGVFVVETKNMKGWIFGSEHQAQWTQKIFRRTVRFQNPLRQNYKHLKALESLLAIPAEAMHSVIVFMGDSTFKAPMPVNVTEGFDYVRYIKSFSDEVLTAEEVDSIVSQIEFGRRVVSRQTDRDHVQHLKRRADPAADRRCPKCGSAMVLRTTTSGPNVGNQFWGCSNYPRCKMKQTLG